MCGLTGFLLPAHHTLASPMDSLAIMTDQLIHRGPDDQGLWFNHEDGIGLGHRRLSILDLSAAGHQPMHSADGRFVIVYNGEIYNDGVLKQHLQTMGSVFSGRSDTEVILALIVAYGIERTLTLISGMFAFAVWDHKEKILYLARDRIGEKPLYYGFVNGAFVFGSELKALRAYPNFKNPLASTSLRFYLQYGYIPAPHSIYAHIYKLLPGSYLKLSQATLKQPMHPQRYWSALEVAQTGLMNPAQLTDAEAIEKTTGMLNTVVQSRMRSDVPIGAFLSGGIDSSLIAAFMQKNSTRAIQTFTIGFDAVGYNEADHAKAIAQHLHTEHTELYVGAAEAWSVIPQLSHIYDEPFADSSAIPTYLVSQLTKQQVGVCLSGDGGDELFGGYNRYLAGQSIWKAMALLPYPIRAILRHMLLGVAPERWQQVLKWAQRPMIGDQLHKLAGGLTATSPECFYEYFISQWHEAPLTPHHLPERRQDPFFLTSPICSAFGIMGAHLPEKMMLTDTLSYLPDDIMVKLDRAGMAVSLESRAPFLDHQLIEFVWTLPLHMKIRKHSTKWLLRQILSKHVPSALFERPKMGFGVPLDTWLRGPLRDWAESLLDAKTLEQQGVLQATPILEKWQEHLSGKRNWQHHLWTVLMLQAWMAT